MQQMQSSLEELSDRQKSMFDSWDDVIPQIRVSAKYNGTILQNLENILTQAGVVVTRQESVGAARTQTPLRMGFENSNRRESMAPNAAMVQSNKTQVEEFGELAIPLEHTTAAHKLLRWPLIRNLLSGSAWDEDYVMRMERNRGVIRVYGSGEGDDEIDHDSLSDDSPSAQLPLAQQDPEKPLGIEPSGILTADRNTVNRYHLSFLEHIQKMHPLLPELKLETDVAYFCKKYCAPKNPSKSSAMDGDSNGNPRGAKRRRTGGPHLGEESQRRVDKTVTNAAVLLVIALGAICEWRHQPLPGPHAQANGSSKVDAAWNSSSRKPSVSHPPPGNEPNSAGRPKGVDLQQPTNLDVLPGFSYYAYASEILGAHQGGNRLVHAQAALLAGLYMGQLAHPYQSHAWIYQAARVCLVLVQQNYFDTLGDSSMDKDQIRFAYWTCLQLESDILAELDLPPSGISRPHDRVGRPSGKNTLRHNPEDPRSPSYQTMVLYHAQIYLRNILNRTHTFLYKANDSDSHDGKSIQSRNQKHALDEWRNFLPIGFDWEDSDGPANDINIARLRAKYYGAMYVSRRPVLYHCLQTYCTPDERIHSLDSPVSDTSKSARQTNSPSMSNITNNAAGSMSSSGGAGSSGRSMSSSGKSALSKLPPRMAMACRECVEAAIHSTVAFDGVRGRPVVTNIFGTAHA